MLDEIRGQLQQITDTAPVSELQAIRTTLDELRALLHQMAGTSTNDDVHQASRLFGLTHDKTGEAVQTLMYALEHVRSFSAVL